jgi:hypothetical protein
MPTIPSDFVQTVMPQAGQEGSRPLSETYQNVQATPQDFGGQVGQALQQSGDMLAQHAVQRQQILNEANVNDVYANQFSPAFRNLQNQFMKLEGKDAETQFPAYQQQMNDMRAQYRANLPNAMQQRLFDDRSTRRAEIDLDGMSRYAAQQTKAWEWNTHLATTGDLISEAEANWNNPQRLQNVQARLDDEIIDYGSKHGWSTEVFQGQRRDLSDKLWEGVIKRQAVSGDPAGAMQTFREQTGQSRISGQAQGKIELFLKPYQDNAYAQAAYGKVTGGIVAQQISAQAQQQGLDPSTALTVWACEGAVTDPSVKNPNSQATGHFQFMLGTWSDMGGTDQDRLDSNRQIELGIKLIKQNSDLLAKDLGRQPQPWEVYLAHQQGIGGAEKLMGADPNANAGQVAGNMKAITLNGGTPDTTAGQFVNIVKDYVNRKSQQFTAQGVPTAQNLTQNYEAGLQAVTDLARQEHPGDPAAQDRYQSHYIQQMGQQLHAANMTDNANRDIIKSGLTGPQGVQSWQDFMSDPARAQAYADTFKSDPSIYGKVDKAITTNALNAWDPPASAQTSQLYDDLNGMKTTDRDQFSKLDLMRYYGGMPLSQLSDLQKAQQAIQKQDGAEAAKHINSVHALSVLKPLIKEAAGDSANEFYRMDPDSDYPDGLRKYNQFVSQFDQNVQIWRQNNNGKLPSDADYREIGREMLFPEPVQQPIAAPGPIQPKSSKSAPAQQPDNSKPDPIVPDRVKQLSVQDTPSQISGFLKAKNVNPATYGLPDEESIR